jgi:hypothetical protein
MSSFQLVQTVGFICMFLVVGLTCLCASHWVQRRTLSWFEKAATYGRVNRFILFGPNYVHAWNLRFVRSRGYVWNLRLVGILATTIGLLALFAFVKYLLWR